MAIKYGKCINIGNDCKVADGKKIIEIPEGNDFVCPDCGSDLVEVPNLSNKEATSNKKLFFIIGAILILCIVVFFVFNQIQNYSKAKAAIQLLSNIKVKENAARHKLTDADSLGQRRAARDTTGVNDLDDYFNKLANPGSSNEDVGNIQQKILHLFTSSEADVIPVNNGQNTSTGMTIGKYIKSISITHRKVTVVDKKLRDGKIFELYVSEK